MSSSAKKEKEQFLKLSENVYRWSFHITLFPQSKQLYENTKQLYENTLMFLFYFIFKHKVSSLYYLFASHTVQL